LDLQSIIAPANRSINAYPASKLGSTAPVRRTRTPRFAASLRELDRRCINHIRCINMRQQIEYRARWALPIVCPRVMTDFDLCGRTLGEFVLVERIGEGGFGAVYRCAQPLLKRDVVIKVLHERRQRNCVAQQRFLREAQLASRLDHPYAAHVYAFGVEDRDGLLWIAMELVQGITLDAWLRERGPMPLEQFVPFFECVAQVVQAAHERGIVHRDLKPSNIMMIERGGQLFPKLLDFGIAKVSHELSPPELWPEGSHGENDPPAQATDAIVTRTDPAARDWRLTPSGTGIGSSAYMSPEQWGNASSVGPASDIYSLGVLAYKALTGRVPFSADSEHEAYRRHLHTDVPALGGEFSSSVDRVLQRALAKMPAARHATALDLASDLRSALRASERELLRSSAQQWEDKARAPGLLWGGDVLADVERWTRRAPSAVLSELECSFVAASQRRARCSTWTRGLAAALVVVIVLAALHYRAAMRTQLAQEQTRSAQRVAEATVTQAELEQGRSALLHGEPDAQLHLAEAYRRGDRSPGTAFMLARALQPRVTEQARFPSTFGRMWSASFSPDGRQIVTTDDQNAQLWDAQSYRLLATLPHGDAVYQAVYFSDGTQIATACGDGTVRIWDAASGAQLRRLTPKRLGKDRARYGRVAASPDGKLVAAINVKGDVADVWETATGTPLAELVNDASAFPTLAFSHDGHWLATGGGDDVRVFQTRNWKQTLAIRGPRIHSLAFDPTSPRLVTGSATGDVALWEIPSGARIQHLRELGEPVEAVAFSPNGQLVVAASRDGAQQIWHTSSGDLQSQFNARHSKIVAVEFDRTSKLVLAAGIDGSVVVADAVLGMPITVLGGPQNVVWSARFDPSSRRVVGASWDGTARVWDATAPYRRWSSPPISDNCGVVTSAAPDRRFMAVGCRNLATRVWDTARDELVAELPSVTHVEGDFTSAFPAVSSAGDRAAIARGNALEIYELPGGRLLRSITHGASVNAVAFASTGRDVVSGAVDGSLLVTRDNGAQLVLPAASGGIDAAEFLADDRVVASDAHRRLRVYDRGGALLANLELPMRVMSLRIDGARLVTVPIYTGKAGPPVLVDLERYRITAQLEGHVGPVNSARWLATNRIITAGSDGTARMWDGSTGQLRQIYRGSSRLLADATLSPDGSLVVAGGGDGLLRFWDRTSGRLVWTLQAHKSHLTGIHAEGGDIVTRGFTGELSRWTLPSPDRVIAACSDHDRCVIVPK
jgi:WD40 repeat protein/serine/threonine protein kinase